MKAEIEKLLVESDLEPSYMQRLYDLAEKSRDEKDIVVRAHAAAVVSLHLAYEANELLKLEGTVDETDARAFATLATAQKLLSTALDSIRTLEIREDCALFAAFLAPIKKQAETLETICGDAVELVMARGDMTDEEERAAFVEVLSASQKAIPIGKEVLTKLSQVTLLTTAGSTRLQ